MSNDVATWGETIKTLRAQRDAARRRLAELDSERRALSLDARVDADARAALAELGTARRELEQEADDIDLALTEADRRLADAEATANREKHRARLGELADLTSALVGCARKVDRHARALAGAIQDVQALRNELLAYEDLHGRSCSGVAPAFTFASALAATGRVLPDTLDLRPVSAMPLEEYERSAWSQYLPDTNNTSNGSNSQ
jgi:chromosome segregation ATPase